MVRIYLDRVECGPLSVYITSERAGHGGRPLPLDQLRAVLSAGGDADGLAVVAPRLSGALIGCRGQRRRGSALIG